MSKTVRVRIAVVLTNAGEYSAFGCSGRDDKFTSEIAFDNMDSVGTNEQLHFIEADIPIPDPTTISGVLADPASGGGSVVPQCG
jgi:hypothetical protein